MYIATWNIFLIPTDTVAQNLIIIFNFSSQRPYLNYIFLSNFIVLIQWNFPWNISANVLIFTNKASTMLLLFNKSESLECFKVFVCRKVPLVISIKADTRNFSKKYQQLFLLDVIFFEQ